MFVVARAGQSIKGASYFMAYHHIPRPPNAAPRSLIIASRCVLLIFVFNLTLMLVNLRRSGGRVVVVRLKLAKGAHI